MDSYFLLKLIHIICAVVLAGTGVGIAFFLFMANRSNNVQAIAVTTRHVVLADWIFTAPAIIVQLISGILLMLELDYSFSSSWFLTVLALFVIVGICWLPVVYIQYLLRTMAEQAVATGALSSKFKKLMRLWTTLGIAALITILVIFWLMIFKPLAVV